MTEGPADQAGAPLSLGARLLELRDLDTAIAQGQRRRQTLLERVELQAVTARLGELDGRARTTEAARQELLSRQAALEVQVGATERRQRELEQKMYAARGLPARELQAMADEVRHLTDRRTELEDVELGLMEEQEPLDAELSGIALERAPLEVTASALGQATAEAEAVIDAELDGLRRSREAAAGRLPEELVRRYESIGSHVVGGVGAARLIGNRCDGCHLELSSVEVERIRRLPIDELTTCEQCGRLLIRAADHPASPGP